MTCGGQGGYEAIITALLVIFQHIFVLYLEKWTLWEYLNSQIHVSLTRSIRHGSAPEHFLQRASDAVDLPEIRERHQQQQDEEHTEGAQIRIEQHCASQPLKCIQWQQAKSLFAQIETGIKVSERKRKGGSAGSRIYIIQLIGSSNSSDQLKWLHKYLVDEQIILCARCYFSTRAGCI